MDKLIDGVKQFKHNKEQKRYHKQLMAIKEKNSEEWEVSNTPITKYKTRRKLMTQQKLLSKSK